MSHTKGKLAANTDRIESEKEHGWANDGWIIAKCEGPDAFANARRLLACWNACVDIETDELEEIAVTGGMLGPREDVARIAKERDELLAALLKVVEWNDKYPSHRVYSHHRIVEIAGELDVVCDEARTILAKYKEKE